ncbi:MAG: NAD(P)H:quinone oxidoreductase [Thermoleophilia bacterium]
MARIGIVYHTMYGSTFDLAGEIAEGIRAAGGTPELRRVKELLPQEIIEAQGLQDTVARQADVPEAQVDELPAFDGILFGSGTRFGNRTAQLSNFLDQTGPLWASGALVGKPAGFFTGAATMHGGHESTILTMSTFAYHHGMLIVPLGYTDPGVGATQTGGGPYGPSHLAREGVTGLPDEERDLARHYGRMFHGIAARLAG